MRNHSYSHLVSDKGLKNLCRKENLQQVAQGKLDVHRQNEMKSDQYLSLGTNIKTKRIKDANVKPGTLKFLEENIGNTL